MSTATNPPTGSGTPVAEQPKRKKVSTHWLYIAVIVAVVAGAAVGLIFGKSAAGLSVIGTGFVSLIKMMIAPIIFCTIVLGIGSVRKASQVGKVGGLALLYFIVMSTFALGLGLLVGNLVHPGDSLQAAAPTATYTVPETTEGSGNFILDIIPTSLLSGLTAGNVLQALFVALLVGFAVQALGSKGEPILSAITVIQRLVFKILAGIMWLAPIGAFGAIAGVVGNAGWAAIGALSLFVARLLRHLPGLHRGHPGRPAEGHHRRVDLQDPVLPAPGVPADRGHQLVGDRAAPADREDGAPGRLQAGRRHRGAHRLLVQPGRHRDLPDHGLAVHRQRPGSRRCPGASSCPC